MRPGYRGIMAGMGSSKERSGWFAVSGILLHHACKIGDVNYVELLISLGVPLKYEDRHGNKAVHHATMWNHPNVLKILINEGAHLDCVNHNQQTPFHLAASGLHHDCLTVLINARSPLGAEFQDSEGNTPLHLAIKKIGINQTNQELYESCLRKVIPLSKLDFLIKNKQKRTVLQTAAEVGNLWLFEWLLDCKGEYMIKNEIYEDIYGYLDAKSSLYLASKAGHYEVVECLLKYLMTDFQCWDQLAQLIPAESPLVRAKHLLHPLVGAIELNQYPIVKLLVGCLIDIHASYRNGDSAMSMTTEKVYCCAHKCFEFSAPVIFKILDDLKPYPPKKAELALTKILSLIEKGTKLNEDPENTIFIDTPNGYLMSVKSTSSTELERDSIDNVVKTSPPTQVSPTNHGQTVMRRKILKVPVTSHSNGLGNRYVGEKNAKIFQWKPKSSFLFLIAKKTMHAFV